MYNDFFGFRERPFSVTPDPRVFYTTPSYQRIYNSLVHSIREGTSLSVMTGEVGTGKTTMLRRVMRDLGSSVRFAYLTYTTLPFEDLLIFLCDDLEIPRQQGGQLQTLKALQEFLTARQNEGHAAAFLIDEAQNLQESVLEDIRHLLNLTTESKTLLPVILVGQPELERKLTQPTVYQLKQRVALHCQLDRLKERDIAPFISHRLQAAGCEREDLFTPEAIQRIAFYAQGIPRLINILCDNALLLGYSISEKTISAELIEEVSQDLGLYKMVAPLPEDIPAQPEEELTSTWAAPAISRQEQEQTQRPVAAIDQRFTTVLANKDASTDKVSLPRRTSPRRLAWAGTGLAFALWSFTLLPYGEGEAPLAPPLPSALQNSKPPDLSDTAVTLFASKELSSLMTRQHGDNGLSLAKEATPLKKNRKEEPLQTKEQKSPLITAKSTSTPSITTVSQGERVTTGVPEKEPQQAQEQLSLTRENSSLSSREPLLIEAASQGDTEKGERLLSEGIIPDMIDDRGWTALMMAALHGHSPMVELLLKRGADVNMHNSTGGTALMMAAIQGRNDILQLLLNKGAKVNTQDTKGWTALMYAARNGHTPTVQILLSSGAEVGLKNTEGQTALTYATARGHQETARALQDGKAGGGALN